ncbi:MAG: hypothetical protein OES09_07470 [Gammaproteobacteria bacterium]|nr:hypothetical protein [Gammaproteobacteria bacterium]
MADLIVNGYFNEDDLLPWERCDCPEVGDPWICLDDEEPEFDRLHWTCTREGGLTGVNFVYLSDYNLRLTSNDCVKQDLASDARASGDLSLWAHCTPMDSSAGELYAFVCYRDQTFNYGKLIRGDLDGGVGPTQLNIEVEDKLILKVVICVIDAVASWFVSGISLPGVETKALWRPYRPSLFLENRLALLEAKVDRLFRVVSKGLPSERDEPGSREQVKKQA